MKNAPIQTTNESALDKCNSTTTQQTTPAKRYYYPSTATVYGRVLGALLRGERLTHLDCLRRFGSSRLSHHIYSLRGEKSKSGWPIDMIEVTVTTTDAGRRAVIGEYFLPSEIIAAEGEIGHQYSVECAKVELVRRVAGRGK